MRSCAETVLAAKNDHTELFCLSSVLKIYWSLSVCLTFFRGWEFINDKESRSCLHRILMGYKDEYNTVNVSEAPAQALQTEKAHHSIAIIPTLYFT